MHYAQAGHDNNFDLIRLGAALAVVLSHSFSIVTGQFASEPLAGAMGQSIGNYAVDVFFTLSGFLVTQSLARDGDLLRFALSRLLRIFPALLVAVLATSLVLGPLVSSQSLGSYFSNIQLPLYVFGAGSSLRTDQPLPGVFDGLPLTGYVNGPLWTIKYELAAYASIASLVLLSRRTRFKSWFVGGAALLSIYVLGRAVVPWPGEHQLAGHMLHFFLSFYIGAALFIFRERIPLSVIGVVALVMCDAAFYVMPAREFFEKSAIAYTVIWLAFLPQLRTRLMHKIGDCSYGLYVFAFPIGQTLQLLIPEIGALALFSATVLVTLPLASVSWHMIERPALSRRSELVAFLSRRFSLGSWRQPAVERQ